MMENMKFVKYGIGEVFKMKCMNEMCGKRVRDGHGYQLYCVASRFARGIMCEKCHDKFFGHDPILDLIEHYDP
jgi:hypothetical protein